MLLTEPRETAYDLRFHLFGVPVRIHPMFWLFSVIFGWDITREDNRIVELAIIVGCMFFSILIHEMGHVAMFQLFGVRSHVVLYSFGGVAVGYQEPPERWQRILVSAGGPAAGFLFWGLAWGASRLMFPGGENQDIHRNIGLALGILKFINIYWGVVNLFPVYPLDGGHIAREVCCGIVPRLGVELSLGISFLLASAITTFCILIRFNPDLGNWIHFDGMFAPDGTFTAVLFAMLAMQSFQMLMHAQQMRKHWDWHDQ